MTWALHHDLTLHLSPCPPLMLEPLSLCLIRPLLTPLPPATLTLPLYCFHLSVMTTHSNLTLPWWKASRLLSFLPLAWTFKWKTRGTLDRCWVLRILACPWNQMMICLLRITRKILNWRPWLGALRPKTRPDLQKGDPLPLPNFFLCSLVSFVSYDKQN